MARNDFNASNAAARMGHLGKPVAVEAANKLRGKLHQLRALAGLTYGCGREGSSILSDDGRDSIQWLISDMVEECHVLSAAAFDCAELVSSPGRT